MVGSQRLRNELNKAKKMAGWQDNLMFGQMKRMWIGLELWSGEYTE